MGYTHPEIVKAIKGKIDAEAREIVAKMDIEDKAGKTPQEAAEWGLDLFFQVREKFY